MFNKMKMYNPLTNNCQHFVNAILNVIKSDFNSDGECGKIIVDFYFKGHYFNSRKDLDDYVKIINFRNLCPNDKKLLICFKNTFDLNYRNDQNNVIYKITEESKNY